MQFSFVTVIPKYLSFSIVQSIYYQPENYDSVLHSGGKT